MTRVLFDLAATQGYGATKFHGGGEYAKTVFRECVLRAESGVSLEAHLDSSRFTDESVLNFAKAHSIKLHYVDSAVDLEKLLAVGDYDRYYSALPVSARWAFEIPKRTKFIFTLHGVRGVMTQGWRLRSKYGRNVFHGIALTAFFLLFGRRRHITVHESVAKKISATSNREIITVSNYGKFSFTAMFPQIDLSEMRVLDSVTEVNSPPRDEGVLGRSSLSARKFFLIVSANRYEKNGYRAMKALDTFFTRTASMGQFAEYKVAITGLKQSSRFVRVLRLKNRSRFIFLDYVSPGEMEELYASATALVYASISEGYGYPPIQAMRYETPSICSGGTSIPEICGDAAIYFNAYDEEEIVGCLFQVCDPVVRASLIPRLIPREKVLRIRQEYALTELGRLIVDGE